MEINWKSAARAFFRRAEAKQAQLDNVHAVLAPMLHEESFDSWQDAARHWYEVTKRERVSLARERLKGAEILQKLKNTENKAQGFYEDLNVLSERHRQERVKNTELLQKIEELQAAIPRVIDCDGMTFEQVRELLRKREAAQPSGNPGDFAARGTRADVELRMLRRENAKLQATTVLLRDLTDLAERIAYADGKHPRDLPDGRHTHENVALIQLQLARETLAALPTWRNAITCEFNEAMYELARGDMDRFADELLDLETVSFRARRAVMERGKK